MESTLEPDRSSPGFVAFARKIGTSVFPPPVHNSKFWATQGLVLAIAGIHDFVEAFGYLPHLGMAYFLPISMFFVPVVYAALYFGLAGAVATALWSTLLSTPNWLLWHSGSERYGVIFQMAVINSIAVFVGSRVDRQIKARTEAETASHALRVSEARYHGLWEDLKAKEEARSILLKKVISAQEEERQRIARELHDELAQGLTALLMGLGRLEQSVPHVPAATGRLIESVKEFTSGALADTRRLILDLRPPLLDDLGLVPAVRMLAETRLEPQGVATSVTAEGLDVRFSSHLELSVFRILQEAINNCARHAQATAVQIRLYGDAHRFRAIVEDDGVGFEAPAAGSGVNGKPGFGILGMSERASLLGGTVEVRSHLGKGTTMLLDVPLAGALVEP